MQTAEIASRYRRARVCGISIGIAACLGGFGPILAGVAKTSPKPVDGLALARDYALEVDRRLDVPEEARQIWASLLSEALSGRDSGGQFVVLVDRSPFVQAVAIFWIAPDRHSRFVGASPASTGKPGRFDYFLTPTGVFEHTVANPDFRALGTRNKNGIRGYGRKGMRVYDFGWQEAERGWGGGGRSAMRLQMHATDPGILEPRLGTIQSKGCIRIPATLDVFLDHHAILDADYDQAINAGRKLCVLRRDRVPTPWSGRFLVIVDTGGTAHPPWAVVKKAR